jgi:hypothetical protein
MSLITSLTSVTGPSSILSWNRCGNQDWCFTRAFTKLSEAMELSTGYRIPRRFPEKS